MSEVKSPPPRLNVDPDELEALSKPSLIKIIKSQERLIIWSERKRRRLGEGIQDEDDRFASLAAGIQALEARVKRLSLQKVDGA